MLVQILFYFFVSFLSIYHIKHVNLPKYRARDVLKYKLYMRGVLKYKYNNKGLLAWVFWMFEIEILNDFLL